MNGSLLRTALYQKHIDLNARMVPFAGFEMPVQYQGVLEETKACRKTGGLFDVSHMGQISIKGSGALSELQKLVTNFLGKVQPHQAQYNLLCNASGGVIDDIIVYHRGENEVFLCVNASNRSLDFQWLKENLPKQLECIDLSDHTSLIAVQGPLSEILLKQFSISKDPSQLNYYWAWDVQFEGIPMYLSRTGYTGEDGFELYIENKHAPFVWDALSEKGKSLGITACGLGARDTLRLEMGYPLHGHEISPKITPLQANLAWVVKLDQPTSFIGKKALLDQKTQGGFPTLKALTILDKRIARQGYEVFSKNKERAGTITSGTFSPHLGCPIALAMVESAFSASSEFLIKVRNDWIEASATSLPFVPSRTKKLSSKA